MIQALIFTDLDGTLLDDRYDLTGAASAMDEMSELGGVVIPVSSKTRVEMASLREQQAIETPFVFENGAGIDWGDDQRWAGGLGDLPHGTRLEGLDYANLCEQLATLRDQLDINFVGFHDFSAEQVSELTNLPLQYARLAKQRLASEPIAGLDQNDQLLILEKALVKQGLLLQKGGRFYTVTSRREKSDAVAEVISVVQARTDRALQVVVCGDSPNDLSMLALGDLAFLFSCVSVDSSELEGDGVDYQREMKGYLGGVAPATRVVEVCGAGHEAWLHAVTKELQG